MATYSFRANVMDEVESFLLECADQGISVLLQRIAPGPFGMMPPPSDPEVEVESDASLADLRMVLRGIAGGEVMLETLRQCSLSANPPWSLQRLADVA